MYIERVELDVPAAPGGTTNAYLVGRTDAVLVDPAVASASLDAALEERSIDAIAVTHTHPDHVGAVGHYADRTDATVWARAGRVDRFTAATGRPPDRTYHEGTTIPVGDGGVRVLDAPGHAPDHVVFETEAGAFVGDCAVAEGSVAVAAPEGDLRAYLTTLRRLYVRAPHRLFPGHGPVVDDPRAILERLYDHRLERDRRVLAAVEDGAASVEAILDAAYDKDLTGVRDLARGTVRAHLEKLATERRLEWDGTRAKPVDGTAVDAD